ncbi:MAG: hypothetical protein HUJ30_00940 [Gammaproteobacteria bacterium]|nr:hypothetical protein [Gammaproteobacteria bacterium]
MPYFVYQISEQMIVKDLDLLGEFENFKEAKTFAKDKRAETPELPPEATKVIFAENRLDAEEKLQEQREAPIMMEWEK